jgi:SAM-dependent methyltransferase
MNYELAYRIGFHPWEDAEDQPSFGDSLSALLDQEEEGREPPYGTALDLGCGSGIWGIQLARRGWEVTGVDIVDKALERARERVQKDGAGVRIVKGDVTDLGGSGVGSDFKLVLDTGTFHGLSSEERVAMGREIDAIAAGDATLLILGWAPKRRGPFPRGASRDAFEAAFPGWTVTDAGPTGFEAPKPIELLMRPDERWYRLRRD